MTSGFNKPFYAKNALNCLFGTWDAIYRASNKAQAAKKVDKMKKQTLTELIDMLNVKMGKHFCLVTRSRAVYGKYNYALNIIDQDGFERGCEMLWQSRYFTADELIAALRFGLAMEYAEFRESY